MAKLSFTIKTKGKILSLPVCLKKFHLLLLKKVAGIG
jgi:hypothetical protein